ncbi:hypothetical protein KJ780_03365 [Candidatus Micrarchaeota archaeon]|nr:hypothetical protein [Candidatus Micrarchaeota archaeon]
MHIHIGMSETRTKQLPHYITKHREFNAEKGLAAAIRRCDRKTVELILDLSSASPQKRAEAHKKIDANEKLCHALYTLDVEGVKQAFQEGADTHAELGPSGYTAFKSAVHSLVLARGTQKYEKADEIVRLFEARGVDRRGELLFFEDGPIEC